MGAEAGPGAGAGAGVEGVGGRLSRLSEIGTPCEEMWVAILDTVWKKDE